mmetsp:Transcript_14578/g.37495  ORF Transcript_14578/g.37495 Transcript_14578/m.37495 type:complete len:526 (-) Transcript_14578:58-1635(-)
MSALGSYGLLRGAQQSLKRKKKLKSKNAALSTRDSGLNLDGLPVAKKTDAEWEFPRDKLDGLTEIGHGQFGVVYIGYADGIVPGAHRVRVAVKTLSADEDSNKDEFFAEASIMKALDGDHKIVRLLGLCTDKAPYYMIMELMAKGDLKSVLRATRPRRAGPSSITKRRMVQLGADVAEGMEYLASVSIVHRDLAARNCLVSDSYSAKVGDFGLTRKTYSRDYYRMKGCSPLPIRWMAPESLEDGVFSSASDMWSFGVLLWEIAAFGTLPYPELDNMEILDKLVGEDYRLPAPGGCPAGLHSIMARCWEEDGEDRPSFAVVRAELDKLVGATPHEAVTLGEARSGKATFYGEEEGAGAAAAAGGAGADEAYSTADAEEALGPNGVPEGYENPMTFGIGGDYAKPVVHKAVAAAVDPASELEAVTGWIAKVTGKKVDSADLHGSLRTGETLCILINKLAPKTVKKVYSGRSAIRQRGNISDYLEGAQKYGVAPSDLFDVEDLFCDDDMLRVLLSLTSLKAAAEDRAK